MTVTFVVEYIVFVTVGVSVVVARTVGAAACKSVAEGSEIATVKVTVAVLTTSCAGGVLVEVLVTVVVCVIVVKMVVPVTMVEVDAVSTNIGLCVIVTTAPNPWLRKISVCKLMIHTIIQRKIPTHKCLQAFARRGLVWDIGS